MRKFKFSLESVLMVRQKTLENERIRLASIMDVYNKQNDVLNEMNLKLTELNNETEKLLQQGIINPQLIANYNSFSQKLVHDITTQNEIIKKTKIDLDRQQEKTKKAYIDVKTLENLREKQKERYNQEFALEEIKILDDIVSSRKRA